MRMTIPATRFPALHFKFEVTRQSKHEKAASSWEQEVASSKTLERRDGGYSLTTPSALLKLRDIFRCAATPLRGGTSNESVSSKKSCGHHAEPRQEIFVNFFSWQREYPSPVEPRSFSLS